MSTVALALLGLGYFFKNKKEKVDSEQKSDDPNGTNIYNSRDFYKVEATEASKVIDKFEKSKRTALTNVVPRYYNNLNLQADSQVVQNSNYDPDLIFKVIDSLDDDAKKRIADKQRHLLAHVDDHGRLPPTDWALMSGLPSNTQLTTQDGILDVNAPQVGGSLLPNRGYESFTHNNMVPFYSGSLKQNMDSDNRAFEGKLEFFTGSFKLNQASKQEVGPMFAPSYTADNIYGNHEKRDLSRYIPSNTGKKNNELPFEQIKVGRGLNDGYTAKPTGGFHNFLRIMPKKTEDLVVNPVFESEGRVNHGRAPTQERTLLPQMYKHAPTLLVENKKGERNFTTVGAVHARRLRPKIILKDTERKRSKFLIGTAKQADGTGAKVRPKFKVSNRRNYFNTPFRNAVQAVGKLFNDFGKSGYRNRLNERAVTGNRSHLLNPKGPADKRTAGPLQEARKTRKQHYVDHARPFASLTYTGPKALPAYDPKDQPRATIRETTENTDYRGVVGGAPVHKQTAYDPTQQARATIRETTENTDYRGMVGGAPVHKQVAYDPLQQARTTIRETTENKRHQGWMKKLGAGTGRSYNPTSVARPTMRQTTENSDYLGIADRPIKKHIAWDPKQQARSTHRQSTGNTNYIGGADGAPVKKHVAFDPTQKAKTTGRETMENSDYRGIATNATRKRHVVYDPKQRARTTIRETTENNKHIAGVNSRTHQNGGAYKTTNYYANNTNRQFTSDYEYYGVAEANDRKNKSYDDAYNMRQNLSKEGIAKGRKPTDVAEKLFNSQINMETKKMDDDRKNGRSAVKTSSVGDYFNPNSITLCTTTTEKNHLPQNDIRLDTSLLDAYKKNPLTQSLHSYF